MEKKSVFFILLVLFCLNIISWLVVYKLWQSFPLEVNFFDVGQGDAIFIQTPGRNQILIDGGPDSTILEKLSEEMPPGDRMLDLIVLTHPHADHLRGLIEVLKRYQVENILWTGVSYNSSLYKEWQEAIKSEGANLYISKAGQKIISKKIILEVLYPLEDLEGEEVKELNNTSIVAKLSFKENSFLFTGDVFKEGELELVNRFQQGLNSDVLKASHQGSSTSNSSEFISAVSPEIVVISVGKENQYGHPHEEVLALFERYGIAVLRTDRDGDIKIVSDGKNLELMTDK